MKPIARKLLLKARKAFGKPPLPEEMLGIVAPDPIDPRDHIKAPIAGSFMEPLRFSLLYGQFTQPNTQGRVSSCGGHSGAKLLEVLTSRMPSGRVVFDPMWLYWYARLESFFEPSLTDKGCHVRSVFRAMNIYGVPHLRENVSFDRPFDQPKPTDDVFRIKSYERIPVDARAIPQVRRTLYQEKLPIVAGLNTFISNDSRSDWQFPRPGEQPRGGHAVLIIGWDGGRIEFLNSWGPQWGTYGIGSVPEHWLADPRCTFDLWTLTPDYF